MFTFRRAVGAALLISLMGCSRDESPPKTPRAAGWQHRNFKIQISVLESTKEKDRKNTEEQLPALREALEASWRKSEIPSSPLKLAPAGEEAEVLVDVGFCQQIYYEREPMGHFGEELKIQSRTNSFRVLVIDPKHDVVVHATSYETRYGREPGFEKGVDWFSPLIVEVARDIAPEKAGVFYMKGSSTEERGYRRPDLGIARPNVFLPDLDSNRRMQEILKKAGCNAAPTRGRADFEITVKDMSRSNGIEYTSDMFGKGILGIDRGWPGWIQEDVISVSVPKADKEVFSIQVRGETPRLPVLEKLPQAYAYEEYQRDYKEKQVETKIIALLKDGK